MFTKVATLTVQQWGNSLAIRIPAAIARRAHFQSGTPVEISLQEVGIAVKPSGERKLSLEERLALFDPSKHSGEVMDTECIGLEKVE
jgi:antitoxin MazE